MTKNTNDKKIDVFINNSCCLIFLFFILYKALSNNKAVKPLMEAYIGGKKVNAGSDVILTLNKINTTTGISIETITIKVLYLSPSYISLNLLIY